jgi:hypothetical protein
MRTGYLVVNEHCATNVEKPRRRQRGENGIVALGAMIGEIAGSPFAPLGSDLNGL